MARSCQRCKKVIAGGGLFYQVRLSAVSGYDGIVDERDDRPVSELLKDVEGMTAEQLEEGVHYEHEVILCAGCRRYILLLFQKEVGPAGDVSPGIPESRLH